MCAWTYRIHQVLSRLLVDMTRLVPPCVCTPIPACLCHRYRPEPFGHHPGGQRGITQSGVYRSAWGTRELETTNVRIPVVPRAQPTHRHRESSLSTVVVVMSVSVDPIYSLFSNSSIRSFIHLCIETHSRTHTHRHTSSELKYSTSLQTNTIKPAWKLEGFWF